ncbi:Aspartyl aminopeptidase [Ruminococcus sp. YE71]|uniref:aminopeptidase n=1 Tax=unclassified Ruminococcus TaxID=2608920 RepID=UPI00088D0C19|nr:MULTISPECIES: aminopeptidase [unclassified Ruminococcus]SDA27295.1 Aspartyl aminopeptidase [Ruminococcus sp. YE78]SFW45252.1 Aspartyl aminopeptidase [Ruminococcus sp. YE71]
MENSKTAAEILTEKLLEDPKNAALIMSDEEIASADEFCEGYKSFLSVGKTERLACNEAVRLAEEAGFAPYEKGREYKAGDRFYFVNRGKAIILTVMGEKPLAEGIRLAAAHIDSPRLDLKQHPLYEDKDMALFKTHYYGGIKKYQWTTVPLALHGVVIRADGSSVEINIGEDDGDPVFCVTDLLIHLADAQMKRTLADGVRGEELNILVGSRPFRDDKASNLVKLNIMRILNEKYGITEHDFVSAELEAVPACKAVDVGFDRSMVGSYGQDDRVCAYGALMAILGCDAPTYTCMTVLTDKEEIGSEGNTGLNSSYLPYFIDDLAELQGVKGHTVISNSICLSADVNAAEDPTFADVTESRNASKLGYGVVFTKYTGARGKSGTSDASAEFVGRIRKMMNDGGVIWQTGELGKVDAGGGGTVACYLADLDIDVIDLGVPVLSMHAPFEITSKLDTYQCYKACTVFFDDKQ